MEHKWFTCGSGCNLTFCAFCQGGLILCMVCGGAEATLTKECCGRQMMAAEQDAAGSGGLDYCAGQWHRADRAVGAASSSTPARSPQGLAERASDGELSTESVDNLTGGPVTTRRRAP